jgi:CDGSH iron-sulfur domain-containing protein 3
MSPKVAALQPAKVTVETGKDYWWCTCGESANQPLCDGSHKGTGFGPQKFTAEKDGDVWFCQCKATKNPPLCDGSHKSVAA